MRVPWLLIFGILIKLHLKERKVLERNVVKKERKGRTTDED